MCDYSQHIQEEYEKKREAMLAYTRTHLAKTTRLMDIDLEWDLLDTYTVWIAGNVGNASSREGREFFYGLEEEATPDFHITQQEWTNDGALSFVKNDDGSYRFKDYKLDSDAALDNESPNGATTRASQFRMQKRFKWHSQPLCRLAR